MKETQHTFTEILLGYRDRYPLTELFDDFLSLLIIGFDENNPEQKKSIAAILKKYGTDNVNMFADALHSFDTEFEATAGSDAGRDILGRFYEHHLKKRTESVFFPHLFCKSLLDHAKSHLGGENLFIDHACSTGRLIMAYDEMRTDDLPVFGLEMNPLFAKIAAINLCMAGIPGEIMCGGIHGTALFFKGTYVIDPADFGLYYSEDANLSFLADLHRKGLLSYPPTDAATKIQVLKFSDTE